METANLLAKSLESLHLAGKSAIDINSLETDYVLDLAVQNCADPLIAAACSDFAIRLISMNKLSNISTISGHKDAITKVLFGKTDAHLLYSCSKDKTIRCWDTRASTSKEVQVYQAPPAITSEILSLDISQTDRLLCAGSEQVNGDSHLLFWDNRQNSLLGCYSECHQDDITQVCFQPGSDRYLASGSADGLVCIFDLSETSEDDALQITSNAESDVPIHFFSLNPRYPKGLNWYITVQQARVGWCGRNGTDCVYCVTSDNSFHVWDAREGDNYCTVNSLSGAHEDGSEEYIVDCIPQLTACDERSAAVLLTGSHRERSIFLTPSSAGHSKIWRSTWMCTQPALYGVCCGWILFSGRLRLLMCTDQKAESRPLSTLEGGHTSTVRCCHWDAKAQTLLTGGEDSLVCLWSTKSFSPTLSTCSKAEPQGKIKAKINVTEHSRKPYSKTKK